MTILFFLFLPSTAHARSFTIDAVDIHAMIMENGNVYVEELFTYSFKGAFNGTTRMIGDDDFEGVGHFEAYQVPDDAEMGRISRPDAVPLKVEKEGYTYKIHRSYKDETRKVFYRYQLDGAARKYEDIGEFYWRFFDEMGEHDLNHLRILISLYGEKNLPENSYGFMHDVTGGKAKLTESGLYYINKKLPGGVASELRLLFPSDFLSGMGYTQKETMLPAFLEEEAAYEKRLALRDKWLPAFDRINDTAFYMLLILALLSVFYPKRVVRLFALPSSRRQLDETDSFILTALKRNLNFKPQDIFSALFRLHQRGIVSVERIPARLEYEEDDKTPDHTFKFALEKPSAELGEYENFLIDWLFTETADGKRSFSLDELPVQTRKEKEHNWRREAAHQEEIRIFRKKFKEWKRIAQRDKKLHTIIRPVMAKKIFLHVLVPLWVAWMLAGLWLGLADAGEMWICALFLLAGYAFLLFKKGHRLFLTLYFLLSIIFLPELGLGYGMDSFYMLLFPLIFIAAFLPSVYPTLKGLPFVKGMARWLRSVRRKRMEPPQTNKLAERYFQDAIALDTATPFNAFYGKQFNTSQVADMLPFLVAPAETERIYSYYRIYLYHTYGSSGSGGSSGSRGGSGGGGGAGAF
ncbi:MAG TPA: DUF2207 domain-containing protein [Bacillaceae bacterium]